MTFRADNTILTAWATCTAQALVRYGFGLRGKEPMIAAWVGNAFHSGLEVHFAGGNGLQREGAFVNEYKRLIVEPGYVVEEERFGLENVKRIFNHYCATHPVADAPFEIIELEKSAAVRIGEWEFWYKRDMLVRGADGFFAPWDHKSTGRINKWWTDEFSMSSQLSGYVWATGQEKGTPVTGAYINAIEVGLLPTSSMKCKTHKVPYSECSLQHTNFQLLHVVRTDAMLAAWYREVCAMAGKAMFAMQAYPSVEYLRFAPREGAWVYKACSGCAFRKWCRLDFEPGMRDEFCVLEPWEPWEEGKPSEAAAD